MTLLVLAAATLGTDRRVYRGGEPWHDRAVKMLAFILGSVVVLVGQAGILNPNGVDWRTWFGRVLEAYTGTDLDEFLAFLTQRAGEDFADLMPALNGAGLSFHFVSRRDGEPVHARVYSVTIGSTRRFHCEPFHPAGDHIERWGYGVPALEGGADARLAAMAALEPDAAVHELAAIYREAAQHPTAGQWLSADSMIAHLPPAPDAPVTVWTFAADGSAERSTLPIRSRTPGPVAA